MDAVDIRQIPPPPKALPPMLCGAPAIAESSAPKKEPKAEEEKKPEPNAKARKKLKARPEIEPWILFGLIRSGFSSRVYQQCKSLSCVYMYV